MTDAANTTITLLETLERSGLTVSVYDIGRRIGLLPRDRALAFERASEPYPLPMQRQAWLAYVQQHHGTLVAILETSGKDERIVQQLLSSGYWDTRCQGT